MITILALYRYEMQQQKSEFENQSDKTRPAARTRGILWVHVLIASHYCKLKMKQY